MPDIHNHTNDAPSAIRGALPTFLLMAVWFGIFAGLTEGIGLLLFQRINWARWGPMLHVSNPIVWVSVLVDVWLFLVLALAVFAALKMVPKFSATRVVFFLLVFLTAYDWLTLTARLYHSSCLLLALGTAVLCSRWFTRHQPQVLRFFTRSLPWLIAVSVLAFVGIQGGRWWKERQAVASLPPADTSSPNVLIIIVDTLRADHLASYGYARSTSPNIDRLAAEGVLFENAAATCSWSLPSHAALLTGRYQFEHGTSNVQPIPVFSANPVRFAGYPTLGEVLQTKGYRTGAFSANRTWFSRDLGFGRGFPHFEDYFHSASDAFVRTLFGREFSRIYLSRSDHSKPRRLLRWLGFDAVVDRDDEGVGNYGGAPGVRKRAPVVNSEVLSWLDSGPTHRPFLAVLNYFDVHEPYGGPSSFTQPWPQENPGDQYDDGLKYVDNAIGELLDGLKQRGIEKKTIVVVTSDHGESLGEHGLPTHGRALYWDLVHVPLVFWYQPAIPAGVRISVPVTNAAIAATIHDLVGNNSRPVFPGPPLSNLWSAPNSTSQPVLSELAAKLYGRREGIAIPTAVAGPMKSLVMDQWHLIVHKQLGNQLYDWVRDPGETRNLIRTPEGQQVALGLESRMTDLMASARSPQQERLAAGTVLHRGVLRASSTHAPVSLTTPTNDYHRIEAAAGSRITVEIRTHHLVPASQLDPVVSIEDAQGNALQSCRDPGDDHTPPPGIPDATPNDFDDSCVNDDIDPGVNTDSRLEILVPGNAGAHVELFVRVSDWNGRVGSDMQYEIAVTQSQDALVTKNQ